MVYTLSTCKVLVKYGYKVHIVHWDHKKLSDYEPEINNNIFLYKRSKLNYESLKSLTFDLNPEILVISGWLDNEYLKINGHLLKRYNSLYS